MKKEEVHLVKKVSKDLGLTYKELGQKIGYSESILKSSVSQNKLSTQLKTSIELYLEVIRLKGNEEKVKKIRKNLKTFLDELDI